MKLITSRGRNIAEDYARRNGLSPEQWRYIPAHSVETLHGLERGSELICLSIFLPPKAMEIAICRDFKIVYE